MKAAGVVWKPPGPVLCWALKAVRMTRPRGSGRRKPGNTRCLRFDPQHVGAARSNSSNRRLMGSF